MGDFRNLPNNWMVQKIDTLKNTKQSSVVEKLVISALISILFIALTLDFFGMSFYLIFHVVWVFLGVYNQQVCRDFQIERIQKDDGYLSFAYIKSKSFCIPFKKSFFAKYEADYTSVKSLIFTGKLFFLFSAGLPFVWVFFSEQLKGG